MMSNKINATCFMTRGVKVGDCDLFHVLAKYVCPVWPRLSSMSSAARKQCEQTEL